MDRATARARLLLFGDTGTEPVLADPAEINILLDMSKMVDKNGSWPTDTGWVETYDANYAIAQAWLLKASRLAPRYLFMSGGKMFSRQQFFDHCQQQYRRYISKSGVKSQRLATHLLNHDLDLVPNNASP